MPSPLRALHLEDSARDAEVVRDKLDVTRSDRPEGTYPTSAD